jgi:hypothetical protein
MLLLWDLKSLAVNKIKPVGAATPSKGTQRQWVKPFAVERTAKKKFLIFFNFSAQQNLNVLLKTPHSTSGKDRPHIVTA